VLLFIDCVDGDMENYFSQEQSTTAIKSKLNAQKTYAKWLSDISNTPEGFKAHRIFTLYWQKKNYCCDSN